MDWGLVLAFMLFGLLILGELLIVGLTCFILWKFILKPLWYDHIKPFFKKLSR